MLASKIILFVVLVVQKTLLNYDILKANNFQIQYAITCSAKGLYLVHEIK